MILSRRCGVRLLIRTIVGAVEIDLRQRIHRRCAGNTVDSRRSDGLQIDYRPVYIQTRQCRRCPYGARHRNITGCTRVQHQTAVARRIVDCGSKSDVRTRNPRALHRQCAGEICIDRTGECDRAAAGGLVA